MSSSSSFNVIRRHGSNATNIRIKELTQELARQRSETAGSQLETDDVRSEGRMDHSTIKMNDERLKFITTLSNANTDFFYEFPTEPDFNFLKVWFMLDHLGARMRDMSGFGNDAYIAGHPTLRRAGLDLGFQQTASGAGAGTSATPVMLFNSGTDIVSQRDGEYIWIPDNPSIRFTQFSAVGFTIAFRFNCLQFNSHYNPLIDFSASRRIASKTDDTANGWNLLVYPTNTEGTQGGVEFEIMDNNVEYARRTTGYSANTWYQVIITYNPNAATSADRIKIYTAGIENSIASTFATVLPTTTNLRIGARSFETGFFYGYIHDFRMYMGKILTQTEITNLNTNEMTIANIPKGRVFIVQYALVSVAMRSKTHKYNVSGRALRNRIHVFNVIRRLNRAKIHKFNLVNKLTRAKIHKFNILKKITRPRIHKYDQDGVLRVPRIHKFNLQHVITSSKIHKYNLGGLQTQYQRFLKSTTAGSNIIQEITFTSTPQALIVWSEGTTANNTFTDNYHLYYGFSDGTTSACVSGYAQDAVTTTNAFSGHKTDKVISMMNTTLATVASEASVTFADNKAIFNWTTNDNRAVYIHCMAIWGVAAAEVKTFAMARTTIGNQTYALNNSSLIPKVLHTITRGDVASWSTTMGNAISIGAATSPSKQWTVANVNEDNRATSTVFAQTYYNQTHVLTCLDDDSGTVEALGSLLSLNPGNFVINWTDPPTATANIFSALVIDGDNVDVGTFIEPGATGTQVVPVATTVNSVKGLMLFNNGLAAGTAGLAADALISIGGASGTGATEQGCVSTGDDDVSGSTITARINKTGSVVRTIFPTATATSSTTTSEAAVTALGTDQFSLNWTTRTGSRRNHYIVWGV